MTLGDILDRPLRKDNWSDYWSETNSLRAYTLAEDILAAYADNGLAWATTREDEHVWFHDGRTWSRNAEQLLRDEIRGLLRNQSSRERVNETVRNIKSLTKVDRAEIIDLPPHKIVVENGIIDLREGIQGFSEGFGRWEMLERQRSGHNLKINYDPARVEPATDRYIPVEFDPEAFPTITQHFLLDILHPEDVSVMWKVIGSCLYRGLPEEKAFMLLGEGANGKSTLTRMIEQFLASENVSNVELKDLERDRFAGSDLYGKLANIAPEVSSTELKDPSMFKKMTGQDAIRAQEKHEPAFTFFNTATPIFCANRPPDTHDDTYAYERRWLYFDFPNTFDDEEAISMETLLEWFEAEESGILNLAVDHCSRLLERGAFPQTEYMERFEDAHARAVNPTQGFVEDHFRVADGSYARKEDIMREYRRWADERKVQPQGWKRVKQMLEAQYGVATGKDPDDGRKTVLTDLEIVPAGSDTGTTTGPADTAANGTLTD